MINKRLVWYLRKKKAFHSCQFGFQQFRGTADAHAFLETMIRSGFQKRQHTVVVSLDIQKAYEQTWTHNVLRKLISYGVSGNMLSFIMNFLKDRRFRVLLNGQLSDWHQQENGLPQGSVLSVTLFLIAINGITDNIKEPVKIFGYADDWYILMSHKQMKCIRRKLQDALNRISKWASKIGFRFSAKKTTAMHFCHLRPQRRAHDDPDLYMSGNQIIFVPEMNVLGLIFDRRLTWEKHILQLRQRLKYAQSYYKYTMGSR